MQSAAEELGARTLAKSMKTAAPPARRTHTLELTKGADETHAQSMARHTLTPEMQAGITLTLLNGDRPDIDTRSLIDELSLHGRVVAGGDLTRGESMLAAQAHTLDALFHALAERARRNMGEGCYIQAADTYMRLALRAQGQCRATWQTLAEMKSPPTVFARQANITNGPQQVNNGAMPAPPD